MYLGKVAINETDAVKEQYFTVEKLIMHPDYNEENYDNDIGVHKQVSESVCVCVLVDS